MDGLIPWERLEARVEPFYPKAGRGRRPYPLRVMLRVHCVQLFYNLSDPGMEDLLYESESVRRFVGLRLLGALPDETTILNFRHLLEPGGPWGWTCCTRRAAMNSLQPPAGAGFSLLPGSGSRGCRRLAHAVSNAAGITPMPSARR